MYEPPRIERIGSVSELTTKPGGPLSDGHGYHPQETTS